MLGPKTVVYTDGACSGNPGPGGWAWAESADRYGSGGAAETTNNRMELQAVHEALLANPGPLHIVTDSTYVKQGIEQWSKAWRRNGWKTKDGKPVKNREIWEPLVDAVLARGAEITFGWVKGHSGDPLNDLVDELAVIQRDAHRGAAAAAGGPSGAPGAARLADLPPDEQRAERRRRDGRIPDGHLLVVLGHAPPELGGWDANPVTDGVRRRMREIIEAKHQIYPDLVVLSGLRPGAEQMGAEVAIRADVPYVAVLPFPDLDQPWSPPARSRFRDLVGRARQAITLERKKPADTPAVAKALGRRDAWLTAVGDEALLVWDGEDRRFAKLHRSLADRFGDDLWVLEP